MSRQRKQQFKEPDSNSSANPPQQYTSTPVPPTVNPLLAKTQLPGEAFLLPSGGLFYNNGELSDDVVGGEIMIHPMVTMDEIIMKTPDRLLNGTAITEVIRRCVPQILKPLEILGKDMDYILIALRKITYGDSYEVIFQHECEGGKEHSYLINIDKWLQSNIKMDKNILTKECVVVFDNNQVCSLVPPRYGQIINVYKTFDRDTSDMKPEEVSREFITSVLSLIDNVDGVKDSNHIFEWLNTIPAGYLRQISDRIDSITNWGVENVVSDICKDCGEKMDMNVSLNPVNFFT